MSEKNAGRHRQTAGERSDVSVPGAHFWDPFAIHRGKAGHVRGLAGEAGEGCGAA